MFTNLEIVHITGVALTEQVLDALRIQSFTFTLTLTKDNTPVRRSGINDTSLLSIKAYQAILTWW